MTYLGYILKDGKRWLTEAWKKTVLQIPVPQTPRQVREFLGTAGFAALAAPLHTLTRSETEFQWKPEHQAAFDALKQALLTAPALVLPDLTKPFTLFVDERAGVAKGVLTQTLGP